jgi:hypothetical protein
VAPPCEPAVPGTVGSPLLLADFELSEVLLLVEVELALNEMSLGERTRVQRSRPQE